MYLVHILLDLYLRICFGEYSVLFLISLLSFAFQFWKFSWDILKLKTDSFIIMYCPSLSLITFLALKFAVFWHKTHKNVPPRNGFLTLRLIYTGPPATCQLQFGFSYPSTHSQGGFCSWISASVKCDSPYLPVSWI